MWALVKDFLDTVMPLLVVIAVPAFSYFGARAGRKQMLEQCTLVLNEQGDEAIMQYKVLRAMINVLLAMTKALHDAGILNGNSIPISKDLQDIKEMMETDAIERKRKSFYVRKQAK